MCLSTKREVTGTNNFLKNEAKFEDRGGNNVFATLCTPFPRPIARAFVT